MQIAHDKKHNKGITATVCKIRIATYHGIWHWHTIYIKRIWNFCKWLSINHIKSAPYYTRSNWLVEIFLHVFKRAIKKANGIEIENEELREFLSIYRITPNSNPIANMSPTELMFARKNQSISNKLIPSKKKKKEIIKNNTSNNTYSAGENLFPELLFR